MVRVGLAVGGAALVLIGGAALTWGPLGSAEERTTALDGIDRIELASGSGDVEVSYAPGARGEIVQRVHRWAGAFWGADKVEHRVEGGALVLATDCGWNCSVDYRITLPAPVPIRGNLDSGSLHVVGMRSVQAEVGSGSVDVSEIGGAVDVRTGSGSVSVRRVDGQVDAHTGSGEITLADIGGKVGAETGSGDIEGRGLRGADIVAKTNSGSARLGLAGPQSADVSTDSGQIELTVPNDRYRVDTDTGSGDIDIEVAQDPSAPKRLMLSSGSGDIVVRQS
ncbi:DUF4097 family beta strand repeat-containing protein [Saccharopolyspora phatthalungensis]|uniref:DUF4097 domain-containing protein n=1 Tax=Saccharopolyspora phatthalungensis TaxID=664693 RepID=A0A840Q729_9PSEU|nr:DUF4097 family beta strand repeat-containing protein [Saccharopolyspora phatthalungensis]MBB5154459.1 hypothetical protein [Saccharopolyspora phatthalungensis]